MKARMRRLSVSVDSAVLDHTHGDDSKSTEPGESRIDRVKKLLSSPLTRRKSACNPTVGSGSSSRVFGNPLAVLAHQEYSPTPSSSSACASSPSQAIASAVSPIQHCKQPNLPYIMTRLCDFIENSSGLAQEGLFRVSGNAKLVDKLRTCFDATGDAPLETDGDVPSAAALLKLFLRELPEPVIPLHLHPSFLEAARDSAANKDVDVDHVKSLVDSLPNENFFALKYLSGFLHRVALNENQNRMNASSLGIVFGPNLFRVSADNYKGLKEQALTNQIVSSFVSDYTFIFEESKLGSRLTRSPFLASGSCSPIHIDIPDNFAVAGSSLSGKSATESEESSRHSYIIPQLTINSKDPSIFQKFKKRKERRLSTLDVSNPRSCSEERPSPDMTDIDIRRCNSSDEMSVGVGVLLSPCLSSLSQEVLLNPPTPSMIAKRRHQSEEPQDSPMTSPSASPSPGGLYHEDRRNDERTAPIRRPPISRTKRMNALKNCADAQFEGLNVKGRDEEGRSSEESVEISFLTCKPSVCDSSASEVSTKDSSNWRESEIDCSEDDDILKCVPSNEVLLMDMASPGDNTMLSAEPVVSEQHRYSWPFASGCDNLNCVTSAEHKETASYPLVQHSAIQQVKKVNQAYEAPVSPSAFRSFLSQRGDLFDPAIPPSPPIEQEGFLSANSVLETTAIKETKKKIHSLKRKLKDFESEFENKHGYRPSYEHKMGSFIAKPIILELAKLRRDLKEMREDLVLEELDPVSPNPANWRSHEEVEDSKSPPVALVVVASVPVNIPGTSPVADLEEDLHRMLETLEMKRSLVGRPEDLAAMTNEQIIDEKVDMQRALLKFESVHGRPDSEHWRVLMGPTYERYRAVKRLQARFHTKSSKEATELQPILEHVAMSFNAAAVERERAGAESSGNVVAEIVAAGDDENNGNNNNNTVGNNVETSPATKRVTPNLHELPLRELMKQLRASRDEKRHLRKVIKKFEDDFSTKMGRKVEKEDRVHLETVYNNYKHTKGRLRLLEALVSKSEKVHNAA